VPDGAVLCQGFARRSRHGHSRQCARSSVCSLITVLAHRIPPENSAAPVDVGGRSTPDGPSLSPLRRRSTKAGVLCVCRPGSGGACCECVPGRGLLLRSGLGPMRGDAEPADAGRVGVFSWSGPCSADRRHRPSPRGFPVGMFSSAGVRVRDRSALSEPPAGAPLGCSAAQGSVFGGSPPSPIAARIPGWGVR